MVVCTTLLVAAAKAVSRESVLWVAIGVILALGVGILLVILLIRSRGARQDIAALEERVDRDERGFNELSGETNRLRDRVRLAEKVAYPPWLFVAIAHLQDRGGHVLPGAQALRFEDRDGREIYTVHLPAPSDPTSDVARDLHGRLKIGQGEYLGALLRQEDAAYAARN